MNASNPASPAVIAEVQALMAVALSTPRKVADVFVSFSPHVSQIAVRVYAHGWQENVPDVFESSIYVDAIEGRTAPEVGIMEMCGELKEVLAGLTATADNPQTLAESKTKQLRDAAAKLMAEAFAIETNAAT